VELVCYVVLFIFCNKYRSLFLKQSLDGSSLFWKCQNAERPQEKGIHVHINDGSKRIVDDTFNVVVLNGKNLERKEVLQAMFERTIT
jgi:hypothetical protein